MLLLHLIAIVVQVVISLLFVFEFRQNKNTIEFNLDECVGTEFSYVCKHKSVYVLVRKDVVFYNTFCRHTWYLRLLIFTHVMLRDIKAWIVKSDMRYSVQTYVRWCALQRVFVFRQKTYRKVYIFWAWSKATLSIL